MRRETLNTRERLAMKRKTSANKKETGAALLKLRQKAEELAAEKEAARVQLKSLEDAQRLVAELQIHEIELELQNDELRRVQEQLGAEHENYADLYRHAPVAYFTFDANDLIVDANLMGAKLLASEPKLLINHPFAPYLTPESLEIFIRAREKALAQHSRETCELTLRRRGKERVVTQTHVVALRSVAARPQLWLAVMTDITAQKDAQRKLLYQASLLENVKDAVIATDKDLRVTQWNKAAEELYGWKEEEVLGKLIDEACGTRFIGQTQAEAQKQLAVEKTWRGELEQRRRDGKELWVTASVALLEDADGKVLGGVTVNHDNTERKRAEEELARQLKELQSWHNLTLDRETRTLELKKEVNELLRRLNEPPRYYGI